MRLNLEAILRNRVTIFITIAVLYLILLPVFLYTSPSSSGLAKEPGSEGLFTGLYMLYIFYRTGVTFYTTQLPEIFFSNLIPFDDLPSVFSKILNVVCQIAYWGGFFYFLIMIKDLKKRNLVISFLGIIFIFSLSVKGCVDMQFHNAPQARFAVTPLKGVEHLHTEENFDYSISPDNKWLVHLSIETEGKQSLYMLNTVNLETGATTKFVLPERNEKRKSKDFDSFYVLFNISCDGWTKNSRYFVIRDKSRDEKPAGFLIDFTDEKLPRLIHNYLHEDADKFTFEKKGLLICSDCPLLTIGEALNTYPAYDFPNVGSKSQLYSSDRKKMFYTKKFSRRASLYEYDAVHRKGQRLTTVIAECPDIEGLKLSPDERYLAFTESYLCNSFLRSDPAQLKFVDLTTKRVYFVTEGIGAHWDSKSEKIYFMGDKGISFADVSAIAKEYPVSEESKSDQIEATIQEFGILDSARLKDCQFVKIDPWVVNLTKCNLEIRIETDKVTASIGTSFGIRFKLKGNKGEKVVITTRILSPGLIRPDSTGETRVMEEWADDRVVGKESYAGFIFLDAYQLVPGKWTIQLLHKEKKLAEKDSKYQYLHLRSDKENNYCNLVHTPFYLDKMPCGFK